MIGISVYVLVAVSTVAAGRAPSWSAGSHEVRMQIYDDFSYDISVQLSDAASKPWLGNGSVAIQCGGERYAVGITANQSVKLLLRDGTAQESSGADSELGVFQAYEQSWKAADCCSFTTTVRYYSEFDAFDFVTTFKTACEGTTTMPDSARHQSTYNPIPSRSSSEFPSFNFPAGDLGIGYVTWTGDALGTSQGIVAPPRSAQQSANFTKFVGGIVGGPLILYQHARGPHPFALALSAADEFKVGIVARSTLDGRLTGGVQGLVAKVTAGYSLRFSVIGRPGVNAAMFALGIVLKRRHGTEAARLKLADDVLSRQLHYETDGGANYCYCNQWWPKCEPGCEPMGVTLKKLEAYHKQLDLPMGLYHLNPFWFSQEAYGGCAGGPVATNLSASPFHFPEGLGALDLPMLLIIKYMNPKNIYTNEFSFDDKQVSGADSLRFWRMIFQKHYRESNLRALVWDGLDVVWFSSVARMNNTATQGAWHEGFAKAALEFGLPMRVDMSVPSDTLASVLYGAHTVGRCMPDSGPSNQGTWQDIGGNAVFLTAVDVRPMMDQLWTTSLQAGSPYGQPRPNLAHDLIIAALSTGPIGIGDMIGATNASLLRTAMRTDGVLLKPASAALRVDRFYAAPRARPGFNEIWAAPSAPARHGGDSRTDRRANSLSRLDGSVNQGVADGHWWWNVLATNVDGSTIEGRPLTLDELWPSPPPESEYLGRVMQGTGAFSPNQPCIDGALASSCLQVWNATTALNVSTGIGSAAERKYKLLAAAPILQTGWVLLGELEKLVPVSPQRFASVAVISTTVGDDSLRELELSSGSAELTFEIMGAAHEEVEVTLVAPSVQSSTPLEGRLVVITVALGKDGQALVTCSHGGCSVEATEADNFIL